MTVGVLALQGDVREHAAALGELGERVELVRRPDALAAVDGLVIPGGESTTLALLLETSGLFEPLREALSNGLPVFGTCAGLILLATRVLDGRVDRPGFGAIDLTVRRNGYGTQRASFEADVPLPELGHRPVHAVFIRAPKVEAVGSGVEILATLADGTGGRPQPVVCRQGSVLVSTFHPELTGDRRLHQLFVDMIDDAGAGRDAEGERC